MNIRWLCWVLLCGVIGCGRNPVPVSGRVTLDNAPLADAFVTFQPPGSDGRSGPSSEGKTDADGNFRLKVISTGADGAMIGTCKVSISASRGGSKGGGSAAVPTNIVPAKYNANSTLTFEVPAGGTTSANFDLSTK